MFDEMMGFEGDATREAYTNLFCWLGDQDLKKLAKKSSSAEQLFRRIGITFNVYGQKGQRNVITHLCVK